MKHWELLKYWIARLPKTWIKLIHNLSQFKSRREAQMKLIKKLPHQDSATGAWPRDKKPFPSKRSNRKNHLISVIANQLRLLRKKLRGNSHFRWRLQSLKIRLLGRSVMSKKLEGHQSRRNQRRPHIRRSTRRMSRQRYQDPQSPKSLAGLNKTKNRSKWLLSNRHLWILKMEKAAKTQAKVRQSLGRRTRLKPKMRLWCSEILRCKQIKYNCYHKIRFKKWMMKHR